MRILYAIQGTGNGHLSRARDIVPCLQQHGEVDILVSGIQADVALPWPVRYQFYGLSFIFGQQGGVAFGQTLRKLRPWRFLRDLGRLPVEDYDLIINDFEPLSAWACRLKGKKCFAMSHQAAFLSQATPRPPAWRDRFAEFLFRWYAPCTDYVGFHFAAYDRHITTPVIRREVRALQPTRDGSILVYLPAYADATLLAHFEQLPERRWVLFSKHAARAYRHQNVEVMPIQNEAFLKQLECCEAVLTGGGFEAPAEALFLGKKLMVIPMKAQYEQHANAYAAAAFGAVVAEQIGPAFTDKLRAWLGSDTPPAVLFPDETQKVVDTAVSRWAMLKNTI